jgi:succinoglycan biosynthesis protein ExoW
MYNNAKVAVIIPFYQTRSGVLQKAVQSALRQCDVGKVEIIIIDDSSPVSARSELAELVPDYASSIRIIEQENAGPAAARNKGLKNVASDTEYVAFLDSDDEWIESHLSNALTALEAGFDFYFSDHYQLNQTISAFNRAKRIQVLDHRTIAGVEHLHEYAGDMFDQILMGNVIGTSTVVYRYRKFPDLRFRQEFVYAGEDYLFWLDLAKRTKKIAFSSLCECTYGAGVNIFAGSGWGTEKSLIRIHYEIKFKKALLRIFDLSDVQRQNTVEAISKLRKTFVADVLHRLAHGRSLDISTLIKHLAVDPQTFVYFMPLAISVILQRGKTT